MYKIIIEETKEVEIRTTDNSINMYNQLNYDEKYELHTSVIYEQIFDKLDIPKLIRELNGGK